MKILIFAWKLCNVERAGRLDGVGGGGREALGGRLRARRCEEEEAGTAAWSVRAATPAAVPANTSPWVFVVCGSYRSFLRTLPEQVSADTPPTSHFSCHSCGVKLGPFIITATCMWQLLQCFCFLIHPSFLMFSLNSIAISIHKFNFQHSHVGCQLHLYVLLYPEN